jgi:hypothetical protein
VRGSITFRFFRALDFFRAFYLLWPLWSLGPLDGLRTFRPLRSLWPFGDFGSVRDLGPDRALRLVWLLNALGLSRSSLNVGADLS